MISDPAPEAPTVTLVEVDDSKEAVPEQQRADAWFESNKNVRVHIALEEDMYKIQDQNFVCFSVIKPENYGCLHHKDGSYKGSLIKFRGVFKTREEADKHIKRVMKSDRHFDVHLVPAFTWAGMDDDMIEDREYADSAIGDIIKGYFKEENNRMNKVRNRIENTEQDDKVGVYRGEEASQFFEEANEYKAPARTVRPPGQKALSLTELADQLEISPSGETIVTKTMDDLSDDKMEAIVAEILLE